MSTSRYIAEDDGESWIILDTHNGNSVMARTHNASDAKRIEHALNFSHKPGEYGYKLVVD